MRRAEAIARALRPVALGLALGASTVFGASPSGAQDARTSLTSNAVPPPTKGVEETGRRPYWGGGHTRSFLSSVLELGPFYGRAQLALGYGKPHWQWIGVEGQTGITTTGGSEYAGLHAASPWGGARVGGRYLFPTTQYFLEKQDSYMQRETEFSVGPRSRYVALEAELTGAFPLLRGSVFAVASGLYVLGVPAAYNIYEESLHVVMAAPYLWRGRLGYVYAFGLNGALRVGAAAELIANPGREAYIVRAGPVLALALTHHLDVSATVLGVVSSPDSLRLRGAEIGQFGFRYRWATGDRYREFP